MPTPTKGPRLGGGPAHERLILGNLAQALFEHDRITTTQAKAKRLRPLAERLVTFAKRGDLHSRRRVLAVIHDKGVVHRLFTEIAPDVAERQGGYTRITKIGPRKGDNAPMAVIELVREPLSRKQATVREAEAATKRAAKKTAAPAKAADQAAEVEAPYGEGSAAPLADGSAPEGFDIKGNEDSKKYHTPESPWYDQTVAEVWFATQEAAEAAGFEAPESMPDADEAEEAEEAAEAVEDSADEASDSAGDAEDDADADKADDLSDSSLDRTEPATPHEGVGGLVRVAPPGTRIRLDLAYDGTDFSGWAAQPGLRTVEGELTAALTQVLRLAEAPRLVVAGRTDAGVHARGQVAHVDLPPAALDAAPGRSDRSPLDALRDRLSAVLPPDTVVQRVSLAPPGFDARFAAVQRRYTYRVATDRSALDPLRRREVLVTRGPLDLAAMNDASARLLGLRDFAAFCRRREGASTVRTLLGYSWRAESTAERSADADQLVATVTADAFCHSMVRALVGAVLEVGRGRREPGWPAELMVAGVRDPSAPVVPPHGLCLEEVAYPAEELLAARVTEARSRRDMML